MLLPQKKNRTEAEQKEKDGSFQGSKAQSGGELLRRLRFDPRARSSVLAWGWRLPGSVPLRAPGLSSFHCHSRNHLSWEQNCVTGNQKALSVYPK